LLIDVIGHCCKSRRTDGAFLAADRLRALVLHAYHGVGAIS
jgi:hypothetical protein